MRIFELANGLGDVTNIFRIQIMEGKEYLYQPWFISSRYHYWDTAGLTNTFLIKGCEEIELVEILAGLKQIEEIVI